MKKNNLFRIGLITIFIIMAECVTAQKPVWVVGHRCNSVKAIRAMLEDGGNGVEMDVRTDNKGQHWCVDHDYCWSEENCDGYNRLSLKQYLALPELKDERFCLLWIDCKHGEYVKELVEYVHKYIPKDANFAISYSLYKLKEVDRMVDGVHLLDWLRDNLRDNEGISLGWVEKIDEMDALFKAHKFPYYKHFYQDGIFNSKNIKCGRDRQKCLARAGELRDQHQFCSRVGAWTAVTAYDAYWFLDSQTAKSCTTNCDAVCVEGREIVHDWIFASPKALQNCIKEFINGPKGGGRCRIATRNDVFYKRW